MAQRNLENARDDFIKAAKTSASPVEMSEARYNLGVTNRLSGKLEIAINDFKHVLSASPYHIMATAHLITILRKNKKESEAGEQERAIREIVQLENEYNQACFEAVCGNTEKALELLKIGLHNSQTTKDWARNNPDFENIRDDPRFKELIGE
jgi:tetratricopeptide (TPR) repeat protein